MSRIVTLALTAALAVGCASNGDSDTDTDTDSDTDTDGPLTGPVDVPITGRPPAMLSEMNLLRVLDDGGLEWNDEIEPYTVNTPLFSDYSIKTRAIYVPPGTSGAYQDNEVFEFPVGSVVIKNFAFVPDFREPTVGMDYVETRLLILTETGWEAWPYVWNAEQTDAELKVAGVIQERTIIDLEGESVTFPYVVPQRNQCVLCHEIKDVPGDAGITYTSLIGVKARHLNLDRDAGDGEGPVNQLTRLVDRGFITGLPPLDEVDAAFDYRIVAERGVDDLTLEELVPATRDYLDINCAHCHNPRGVQGITSQLFLNHDNTDEFNLGVCKKPGSAGGGTGGYTYDIVPGNAEESILHFRIRTVELGAVMPLLGRVLAHERGADLVGAWIDAMPADDCL